MANLAATPLVNAKLYRHFAAVTFAITLCVAMFANGEARQVVNDGVSQDRQAAQLREAEAKKFGVKQIGDRRSRIGTLGGFGEDYDPGYGAGFDAGGSQPDTRSSGSQGPRDLDGSGLASAEAPGVLSPDEMAQLDLEQQGTYLKNLRTQSAPKREQEVPNLASIEAGSRARSGSRASD